MRTISIRRIGVMAIVGAIGAFALPASLSAAPQQEPAGTQEQDLADRARGESALEEARDHMEAGRWTSAANAYADAIRYLPTDAQDLRAEAMAGLQEAQEMMDEGATIQDVGQEIDVLKEQARVEFENAISRARELLARGDYEGAQREALTAQVRLRRDRNLFSESEFRRLENRAKDLLANIDRQRELAELDQQRQIREETLEQQQIAEQEEALRQQRDIQQKLQRVRELQLELKYDEALQVIQEILFIDAHHPAALALRDVLIAGDLYRNYAQAQRRRELSYSRASLENLHRTILPQPNLEGPGMRGVTELMQYPEDWNQLSIMRAADVGFTDTPEDQVVFQRLSNQQVNVDFRDHSFEQAVDFLETVSGVTFYVDWKALEMIGVDRDDRVTMDLGNIPVSTALQRLTEQFGDQIDRPEYVVQDGLVTISTDDALRKRTMTVVYDIRDLLFEVPYFDNAPNLDLDTALAQGGAMTRGSGFGGAGGGLGGGGGNIFDEPGEDPARASREELVDQIVGIIQETIDPDGWRDMGGDTGSLQELNGNLIITNTPGNHRQIEGLLEQLREIRALQINVETRVLTVSNDWFERIGVDLDLYFNTNDEAFDAAKAVDPLFHLSDFFNNDGTLKDPLIFDSFSRTNFPTDPNDPSTGFANQVAFGQQFGIPTGTPPTDITFITGPVGQPVRAVDGFAPIGFQQSSFNLLESVGSTTDFGTAVLSANPAASLAVQFLDDVQVDLLIEATQADQRSVILTAPRLTFFNGQRAWIAVTTQQAFVSTLVPIVGDASGAFQPVVSKIADGFVLDVEAVISSDRRYVTITVHFGQAEIIALQETAFQGAAGGGFGGGGAQQFEGEIQLPIIEVSEIRTTVSVPDKGTVLLGGQRTVEEFEIESGVPVLSKIPWINRFFTNRMTSKTEQTLLILIRPEIIIQQENEDILFPGLSDTLGGGAAFSTW